jgi:hypothetical protein
MTNTDFNYFRMREQQERESAERTDDSIAKRVHLDMAERYSKMAQAMPIVPPAAAQTA